MSVLTPAPTSSMSPAAKLTPLVAALKASNLTAAQSLLADTTLTGSDLVNVAHSVAGNSAAVSAVLADARVGAPEVSSLVNAAVLKKNDQLLAALVKDPKISLLKNTSVLNRTFKDRPYDMAKMMTPAK